MIKNKKEKLEKITNKMITFLLCGMLLITNLLVGAPVNNNVTTINIIVTLVAMIFIITNKISKKEKIIENRLDICILILCISSLITLIFNTYTSLTGCINYVLKYISVFLTYIMIRSYTKEKSKVKRYIINIIIISSIILVIFGIDKMTTNIFNHILVAINMPQIEYEEIRMDSLFSYANAFSAFCAMAFFLAIGKWLKSERKITKNIYSNAIFLIETGIILSYSRTVFIFLVIVFFGYIILLKNKELRIKILEITIITGIFAIIYTNLYMKFLASGSYNILWILLFTFSILSSITLLILEKLNNKMLTIKIKYIIIIGIVILIVMVIIVVVGLYQKEPLIMFNSKNANREVTKEIYQVQGNTNYIFRFDIEAKSNYKNTNIFKITILEKNKFFDNIKQTELEFSTYDGEKEISITTTKNTTEIFIIFSSQIVKEDIYLKINKLDINNEEIILKYKYLPTELINKIKNINFNTKSAWERGIFIKDALKLVKDNLLFGIGGDGWQYREGEVQSYSYWAREVHSYPIQVLLEFGIIGFLALVGIAIYIIKYSYLYLKKEKDVEVITILCSILVVFLHSCLDFDMSYMCIMLMVFTLMGILNTIIIPGKNVLKKTKNVVNILVFIGLIPILTINILNYIVYSKMQYIENENNIDIAYEKLQIVNKYPTYLALVKDKNIFLTKMYAKTHEIDKNDEIIENIEFILKHEKYNNTLEHCKSLIEIYSKINNITEKEYIKKIEEICNVAKDSKIMELYNTNQNIKRQLNYLDISNILIEKYEKTKNEKILKLSNMMCQKVIDEYESVLDRLKDYEKCRISEETAQKNIELLKENYEKAKSMVK